MEKQCVEVNIQSLPSEISTIVQGAKAFDSSSCSSAKVYYFDNGYYLKIDEVGELKQEVLLTRWFHQKGFGVEIVSYVSMDKDYMLTKEADGKDGLAFLDNPERVCQEYARVLRKLHSMKPIDFPCSSRMERYIERAEEGYQIGRFDERVLHPRFPIKDKHEAWEIMQVNKHRLQSDTLIHGDPCIPNLILKDYQFSCFIDVAMAGFGDKHIDLYWVIWSLWYNLGTDAYTDYFLDLYGRENYDYEMLRVIAAFEVFG